MTLPDAETPASSDFFDINGASLYVEQHGSGHPVILVHGSLTSRMMWDALIPYLSDQFRVITMDNRGHGRSTNPAGELSHEQIADDVAALIQVLGLERPIVGGWSKGGQVALEIGFRHMEAVGALMVGATFSPDNLTGFQARMKHVLGVDANGTIDFNLLNQRLDGLVQQLIITSGQGEEHWRELAQQTATMVLSYRGLSNKDLQAIQVPTLVFGGDQDPLFPPEVMLELYRGLPDAEFAICPGTNHFRLTSRASVFGAIFRSFVERHATLPS